MIAWVNHREAQSEIAFLEVAAATQDGERTNTGCCDKFPALSDTLPPEVMAVITRISPRQAGLTLQEVAGKAALRARINRMESVHLLAQDVVEAPVQTRTIGFT